MTDRTDRDGRTALHRVFLDLPQSAHPTAVGTFVSAGADPDRPNAAGITARALAHRIADFDASLLPAPPEG